MASVKRRSKRCAKVLRYTQENVDSEEKKMPVQIAYQNPQIVIPTWTFADKLRKCRGVTGMDQRTFAEHIGVKASAYAQWEADNNKPRDIVTVAKSVERLTRVPAAWLLGIDVGPAGFEPTTSTV